MEGQKRINSSSLPVISYLDVYLDEVRIEDIQILGMLPSLCYVHSELVEHNRVERLVFSTGALFFVFEKTQKIFVFHCIGKT